MAINRERKEELVALYKEHLEHATAIIFTDYRGTKVSQIQSLRHKMNESGAKFVVAKNTLLKIALKETGRPQPDWLLSGPNGVAFVGEDVGRTVTALKDWIKAEKIAEIRGAILDQSVLDSSGAESLADLPTKEQMLAILLGTLNAPASALARIINAPGSSLARVINAHIEKQQEAAA